MKRSLVHTIHTHSGLILLNMRSSVFCFSLFTHNSVRRSVGSLACCQQGLAMQRACHRNNINTHSTAVHPGNEKWTTTTRHKKLQTFFKSPFSQMTRAYSARLIDGTSVAQEIKDEIKEEVERLIKEGKRQPRLAVLLIGNDPASIIYVNNKKKAAEYTGVACDVFRIPASVKEKAILKEIQVLNNDRSVDGILIQLPLPEHMCERLICDSVLPQKDVDGFNVLNIGRFCVNQRAFIPATPSGVLEIINRLGIQLKGKNAVVCGRSKNVGMPIAMHLSSDGHGETDAADATTTICHRYTPPDQLKLFTSVADIVISATGRPGLITADMIKEGAIVIDVGITRILNRQGKARLVGDVDFESVVQKASYLTPVPGGVGPVTVAMVIKNTLLAYSREIDYNYNW